MLNCNKSHGPDEVPARVLKELSKELALPFRISFNKSIDTEVLPLQWKTIIVTPVLKKGTHINPYNYWPISPTCILCKVT